MDTIMTEPEVQDSQAASLRTFIAALEALRHHTGEKEWTLAKLLVLATVGMKGEVPQADLAKVTQLSGAAVSRLIYEQLGPNRAHEMQLLRILPDPDNRSRQIISLTKAGKLALDALVAPIQRRLASDKPPTDR